MQHILGVILRDNEAELMDDDTLGEGSVIWDLFSAVEEGKRRISQNPNIKCINIYEVFDGVKRISASGRYQLVYQIPVV